MRRNTLRSTALILALSATTTLLTPAAFANTIDISPMVSKNIIDSAKKNANWKFAHATGEQAQVVFMNISPQTNPNNEIGLETHPFDQVILVVSGKGKAILNGKETPIAENDLIFIPKGTPHNVVNLNKNAPLKIISFYSQNDILAKAAYKTKADQPQE